MSTYRLLSRRTAILEMGKTSLALVLFGAACSNPETQTATTGGPVSTTAPPSSVTTSTATTTQPTGPTEFERVDLDFVSAYLLFRGDEAVLVDTGVAGSADAIAMSLTTIGMSWDSVAHVILTHKHPDHIGSLAEVIAQAPQARIYAGVADIPEISPIVVPNPVKQGDEVFGLEVIETPGHTAGHISILDRAAGVLVAGDALNGIGGGVSGPNPSFSENMTVAIDSVRKLAGYTYDIALFGHGEPVLANASQAVSDLAAGTG
jgi:glyoxylase-like metal-dependent hydrolase (beta-lactamase superfamily II)